MVNIDYFVHSLKLTWINRLLGSRNYPWLKLCQKSVSDVNNLIILDLSGVVTLLKKKSQT